MRHFDYHSAVSPRELPLRRSPLIVFAIALFWLAACAQAGDAGDDDDTGGTPDASAGFPDAPTGGFPDAPTGGFPDAPISGTPDAPISGTPDAPVSGTPDAPSGPFCTDNSQCTVAGECCLTLGNPSGFCAPGTEFNGECIPF